MATTGQKISKLRQSENLSQEEFAEKLNVARQTVSRWECDEILPNLDNANSICKYFGVPIEYLTATNGKEEELAAANDIETEIPTSKKKRRPSVGWIIGVILSCVIPVFDIVTSLVFLIINNLPDKSDSLGTSEYINWKLFWFLFAFTCVSLVALTILIVFRIKKNRKNKERSSAE